MACRLITAAVLALCVVSPPRSLALEPRTEHTRQLAPGEEAGVGTLADIRWLAGTWRGEAFGKEFEEVWSAPSAGSMVGMFKLMGEEGVDFYELMVLDERSGNLTLRVKHFSADFTAWEEKGEHVQFDFVGLERNAVHFSGISFYRVDHGNLVAYLVMRTEEGFAEERITYQRVR